MEVPPSNLKAMHTVYQATEQDVSCLVRATPTYHFDSRLSLLFKATVYIYD